MCPPREGCSQDGGCGSAAYSRLCPKIAKCWSRLGPIVERLNSVAEGLSYLIPAVQSNPAPGSTLQWLQWWHVDVHLYLVFHGLRIGLRVEPNAVEHVDVVPGDRRLPGVGRSRPGERGLA